MEEGGPKLRGGGRDGSLYEPRIGYQTMQVGPGELEAQLARRAARRAPTAGVEYVGVTGVRGLKEAGLLKGVRAMMARVYGGEEWYVNDRGGTGRVECLYEKKRKGEGSTRFVIARLVDSDRWAATAAEAAATRAGASEEDGGTEGVSEAASSAAVEAATAPETTASVSPAPAASSAAVAVAVPAAAPAAVTAAAAAATPEAVAAAVTAVAPVAATVTTPAAVPVAATAAVPMAAPAAAVGAATDGGAGAGRKRGREGEEEIADVGGKRCRTGVGGPDRHRQEGGQSRKGKKRGRGDG